jgi:hypothetical protein
MVVMSGALGAAVEGRTAVEADDTATEEDEAVDIASATRREGWAVVAREFAAEEVEARGATGASSVGRAAEIALRFLRGCLTSEVTMGGGTAGGLESDAVAAGGVDAGMEVANACDATTGCV